MSDMSLKQSACYRTQETVSASLDMEDHPALHAPLVTMVTPTVNLALATLLAAVTPVPAISLVTARSVISFFGLEIVQYNAVAFNATQSNTIQHYSTLCCIAVC